jgi:hypothetical protein
MRTSRLTSTVLATAIPLLASACTYQQSTDFLTPAAPTLPSGPSTPTGGVGPLEGIWAAEADFTSPESWSCTGIQWHITTQTATTISGTFMGICSGTVLVNGLASGELSGSDVTIHVEGTASLADNIVTCPFTLNGTGHIVNNNEMQVEYEGTTCFGPVHGEETLRRPATPGP